MSAVAQKSNSNKATYRRRLLVVLSAFLLSFAVTSSRADQSVSYRGESNVFSTENLLRTGGLASVASGAYLMYRSGKPNPFAVASLMFLGSSSFAAGHVIAGEEKNEPIPIETRTRRELAAIVDQLVRIAETDIDQSVMLSGANIRSQTFDWVVEQLECKPGVIACAINADKRELVGKLILELRSATQEEFLIARNLGVLNKERNDKNFHDYIAFRLAIIYENTNVRRIVNSFDLNNKLTAETIRGIGMALIIDQFGLID